MCLYVCVCMVGQEWHDGRQPDNLTTHCTNFQPSGFNLIPQPSLVSVIAEVSQGSPGHAGQLPAGHLILQTWVSAFSALPFISQQLNLLTSPPYAVCLFQSLFFKVSDFFFRPLLPFLWVFKKNGNKHSTHMFN